MNMRGKELRRGIAVHWPLDESVEKKIRSAIAVVGAVVCGNGDGRLAVRSGVVLGIGVVVRIGVIVREEVSTDPTGVTRHVNTSAIIPLNEVMCLLNQHGTGRHPVVRRRRRVAGMGTQR